GRSRNRKAETHRPSGLQVRPRYGAAFPLPARMQAPRTSATPVYRNDATGRDGGRRASMTLDGEQKQKREQQREDAERFRDRETEDQTAELAIGRRRIAQRARQIAAENVAQTESGTGHAETCQTGADVTCCFCFHVKLLKVISMF